jgi:membrane dipeptidase
MGEDDASTATRFRQIGQWVQRVGPQHVGLGTVFVHDPHDMQRYMRGVKSPPGGRYDRMLSFFQPEQLPELVELMLTAGYDERAVAGILGDNYLRVLEACGVD